MDIESEWNWFSRTARFIYKDSALTIFGDQKAGREPASRLSQIEDFVELLSDLLK